MSHYETFRLVIGLIFVLIAIIFVLRRFVKHRENKYFNSRVISSVGIFGAIAAIFYVAPFLSFSLPFFPSFLEIHFDEVFALIAGFAYGPFSGFLVILIKTIIKLPFTSTLCVGELADFLYGAIFVLVSSIIYKKYRNIKGAIVGLLLASLFQLIIAAFVTTFILVDFYIFVMGFPKSAILAMCQAVNPYITNLNWDFFLWVGLPFNAFKDVIIALITLLLYKKSHRLIDKMASFHFSND